MGATLLLRPELDHQRYRLTCRMTLDAPLRGVKTQTWLDYAERELRRTYRRFIEDMEKQGWSHIPGPMQLKGPFSHIDPRGIPNRPIKPKRQKGRPSVPIDRWDRTDWGYYTEDVAPINEQTPQCRHGAERIPEGGEKECLK